MSIDFDVFTARFPVLTERFRQNYSAPTIAEWYDHLDEHLTTKEFDSAVTFFFRSKEKFMPTSADVIEHVEARRPTQVFNALEAVKVRTIGELEQALKEEPREDRRQRIQEELQQILDAKARALTSLTQTVKSSRMTSVGKTLDTTGWTEDPILNAELKNQESQHENF